MPRSLITFFTVIKNIFLRSLFVYAFCAVISLPYTYDFFIVPLLSGFLDFLGPFLFSYLFFLVLYLRAISPSDLLNKSGNNYQSFPRYMNPVITFNSYNVDYLKLSKRLAEDPKIHFVQSSGSEVIFKYKAKFMPAQLKITLKELRDENQKATLSFTTWSFLSLRDIYQSSWDIYRKFCREDIEEMFEGIDDTLS